MEFRVLGVRKLRKMIERGNPLSTVTQVMSQCTTKNNLLKARIQHATQGGTMTKLGLLKSGKLVNRWMIERGNPLSALKEEHCSQQFIIGDDEAELELSLGPRSFLDRVSMIKCGKDKNDLR